jgi:hypothetical protein
MTNSLPRQLPVVPTAIPNNFGPTLLIAVGALTLPLGIGLPLLLLGLARVRTLTGQPAVPQLSGALRRFRHRLWRFGRILGWVA